jgi:hypothetical protein
VIVVAWAFVAASVGSAAVVVEFVVVEFAAVVEFVFVVAVAVGRSRAVVVRSFAVHIGDKYVNFLFF